MARQKCFSVSLLTLAILTGYFCVLRISKFMDSDSAKECPFDYMNCNTSIVIESVKKSDEINANTYLTIFDKQKAAKNINRSEKCVETKLQVTTSFEWI